METRKEYIRRQMEEHRQDCIERKTLRIITVNGQTVDCWLKWDEDTNLDCVFDNEAFDGVWSGEDGINTLYQAVKLLTAYAKENNTVLVEVTCN